LRRRIDGFGCAELCGLTAPRRTHTTADHHAAQEDHDRHYGDRHEQKDELLPVQLDFVNSFV
jgi:hypothetical protein